MNSRPARLLAFAAAAAFVMAAFLGPGGLPAVPLCWFKALTGLPCPGCGLTHSFCAMAQGRFGESVDWNPFGPLFFAAFLAVALAPLIPAGSRLDEIRRRLAASAGRVTPWLVAAIWLFGGARIILHVTPLSLSAG